MVTCRRAFQQQQVKKVISDLMTEFSNKGTVVLLSPIDQILTDLEEIVQTEVTFFG